MATSEGQSVLIENEIAWNTEVNMKLSNNDICQVPKVYDIGKFQEKYTWEITDFFEGKSISDYPQDRNTSKNRKIHHFDNSNYRSDSEFKNFMICRLIKYRKWMQINDF